MTLERRVNIPLRGNAEKAVDEAMQREGVNQTDAVNALIRRGGYLSQFMNDPNARIYVERDGKQTEIVIL